MPVLPLLASITVCPALRRPVRSASSMTPRANRSLTEPMGLNASSFAYRATCAGASFRILTTGVRPIVSRMLLNRFLPVAPFPGKSTALECAGMSFAPEHRYAGSALHSATVLPVTGQLQDCLISYRKGGRGDRDTGCVNPRDGKFRHHREQKYIGHTCAPSGPRGA